MTNHFFNYKIKKETAYIIFKNKKAEPISKKFLEDLSNVFDEIHHTLNIKYIIFENATETNLFFDYYHKPSEILNIMSKWEKMLHQLVCLPKIAIIVMEGITAGAGLQLAFACDFRIAHDKAHLRFSELEQGVLPGMELFRLSRLLGPHVAEKIIFFEGEMDVKHALKLGIIDYHAANIDEHVILTMIKGARRKHPIAIEMAKRLIYEALHDSYDQALGHYLAAQNRCLTKIPKRKRTRNHIQLEK